MRVTCSNVNGFWVEITRFLSTITVDQVRKKKKDIRVECWRLDHVLRKQRLARRGKQHGFKHNCNGTVISSCQDWISSIPDVNHQSIMAKRCNNAVYSFVHGTKRFSKFVGGTVTIQYTHLSIAPSDSVNLWGVNLAFGNYEEIFQCSSIFDFSKIHSNLK